MTFGEKASCFTEKVSMKTTEGAFLSKTSMRRFSDSSRTAREEASADRGFPSVDEEDTIVVKTAAAELNNILRRFVPVAIIGCVFVSASFPCVSSLVSSCFDRSLDWPVE